MKERCSKNSLEEKLRFSSRVKKTLPTTLHDIKVTIGLSRCATVTSCVPELCLSWEYVGRAKTSSHFKDIFLLKLQPSVENIGTYTGVTVEGPKISMRKKVKD